MDDHGTTRTSYDTVAAAYAEHLGDELTRKPLDRALLAALIEQADGTVADLGCGPGHISGWLAERGARTVGIDLSPAMVARAAHDHPGLDFREGDLLSLPAADGEFGAAIAMYSIIHLEPATLPRAFAEVHRVLRPDAPFLVSFHLGTEIRHLDEWWGHPVDVDFRFLLPDDVIPVLEAAGFALDMRMERAHHPGEVETRRAYLLGRRLQDS